MTIASADRRDLRAFDNGASPPIAKVLTTSFAGGDQATNGELVDVDGDIISVGGNNLILLTVTMSGTLVDIVHIKIFPRHQDVSRGALPNIPYVITSETRYGDGEHTKASPAVSPVLHTFPIHIISGYLYVIQVKRTGGDGTSAAIITADLSTV